MGSELRFLIEATDPDLGTTLSFAASDLPEGATVDPDTGEFVWTPGPGQAGIYTVGLHVSDSVTTSSQAIVILADLELPPPAVTVELTPSFPALEGDVVLVHAIADSLADIVDLTVTFDGTPLALDDDGRALITAPLPGKYVIEGTATDADGLVGSVTTVLKVRDASDQQPPLVALAAATEGPEIPDGVILGSVLDDNLDSWTLEIRRFDEAEYHVLATGDATVNNAALATLDVQDMPNGFYQLRLTARDIGRRVSRAETVIEVRSDEKRAFLTIQSDLTVTVGDVVVDVARGYDSSRREREGDLGYGWRFLHREVDLRSSVPPTGYENQGLYAPYREGTRVYLATPDNQELAFQFQPQRQTEPGLVFYAPFWQPLETVATGWTLHTEDLRLMRGGNMFFEHETGRPYNPSSPFFAGTDFVLTAPDGTRYEIDAQLGIISQTDTNGNTVYIGDSGIAATSGQSVQLVYDGQGRVARLVAPDGRTVIYQYDAAGNLLAVREPATGQTDRFGYDALRSAPAPLHRNGGRQRDRCAVFGQRATAHRTPVGRSGSSGVIRGPRHRWQFVRR